MSMSWLKSKPLTSEVSAITYVLLFISI